jgi:hypothetical protein
VKPTDTTFGADFDADLFRSAITSTMQVGMAFGGEPDQQCTFIWTDKNTYSSVDQEGAPYDFAATPVSTETHPDVVIPVAMDLFPSDDKGASSLGELDQVKAALTILDIHYELVRGADLVRLGNSLYTIDYVAPPVALFDVNIYTMYITSLDEA